MKTFNRQFHQASAGANIAENIEGRERYPINVRYDRDFRDNLGGASPCVDRTPAGAQVPLGRSRRSHSRVARP